MKFGVTFALLLTAAAVSGLSVYASSGVIELEIPGMNEETAAAIAAHVRIALAIFQPHSYDGTTNEPR